MPYWAYRLARGAGYSRWQSFRGAFLNAKLPDRKNEIQAERDASLGRLWKSGDEKIKGMILSDMVREYAKFAGDPAGRLRLRFPHHLQHLDRSEGGQGNLATVGAGDGRSG